VSNWQTAEFYRKLGASRVILLRELTIKQIKDIRQHTDMELEVFVHGAMCRQYLDAATCRPTCWDAQATAANIPSPAGGSGPCMVRTGHWWNWAGNIC